jgi:hypothetical protein
MIIYGHTPQTVWLESLVRCKREKCDAYLDATHAYHVRYKNYVFIGSLYILILMHKLKNEYALKNGYIFITGMSASN